MKKDAYGLTPFELSMYLAQLADPSSTEYSVDCYFDISGSKKEAVHSAVSDMIRNHEILHSRYEARNGIPVRILTDDYPRIHWTTAPAPAAVRTLALQEKAPFDLREVPVRFTG